MATEQQLTYRDAIKDKPAFGARVLVWDVRYKQWTTAYYVRNGQSNHEGHFEVWLRGHHKVLTGARFWLELPPVPQGVLP